jgi:nucleotide-binding universal stress UspA family protein
VTEPIVVGYIPTPEGVAAFERAKVEATLRRARLFVVNTGQSGNYASPSFASAEDLDAIDDELKAAGIGHEVLQPTTGLPAAAEIVRVAEEQAAGLIVIGIRRRSPVGKLIMGSTAQEVLLSAPCAVLAVKPDAP